MKYPFDYSEEKNLILKEARGIGFEEAIEAINSGGLLANLINPNQKRYPSQRIFVVEINDYTYNVPYIIDTKRKVFFLKTLYPNRKMKKKYKQSR